MTTMDKEYVTFIVNALEAGPTYTLTAQEEQNARRHTRGAWCCRPWENVTRHVPMLLNCDPDGFAECHWQHPEDEYVMQQLSCYVYVN